MCGIFGISLASKESFVNQSIIDGLTLLEHRGQDASGIVTLYENRFQLRKGNGPVAQVFSQEHMLRLRGNVGIGHVRYPTSGGGALNSSEAQPFYTNYPFGIALAHNGTLTNASELLKSVLENNRHINTDSDSEVLLNVIAEELQRRQYQNHSFTQEDIFDAIRTVMRKCRGGYSVVLLINNIGLVAFRDPNGIRPLSFGSRVNLDGEIDYVVASESVAYEALYPKFKLERDVKAGEAIFISTSNLLFAKELVQGNLDFTPCLFEYVYFARPDSTLDGVAVSDARAKMGEMLAKKISTLHDDSINIDVIIPIPETSRNSAMECAKALNRPYREGFVKNRYIARTFIMPGQEVRRKKVRLKLNTINNEFEGKDVLLIDDSIVRGTTSYELIQMAREAGAKSVIFASAAPPVIYPNVYGIDIPTRHELVAYNRSIEEIREILNADLVIYNNLEDVCEAVRSLSKGKLIKFEDSCFSGYYVTKDINDEYLNQLEQLKMSKSGSSPRGISLSDISSTKNELHVKSVVEPVISSLGFSYFECPHTPLEIKESTSTPKSSSKSSQKGKDDSDCHSNLDCEGIYNDNE